MAKHRDEQAIEQAQRQVYEEQEANARATAGTGPVDEDFADEFAADAASEEFDEET